MQALFTKNFNKISDKRVHPTPHPEGGVNIPHRVWVWCQYTPPGMGVMYRTFEEHMFGI